MNALNYYSMRLYNPNEIRDWQEIEIFGIPALFTNYRIDRSSLPESVFAFDVRCNCGNIDFAAVEHTVIADYTGTVVAARPIKMTKGKKWRNILGNYNFTGCETTFDRWLNLLHASDTKTKRRGAGNRNPDKEKPVSQWWNSVEFGIMEKITGYRQSDFDPAEGYQAFVDACNECWENFSKKEKLRIWENYNS